MLLWNSYRSNVAWSEGVRQKWFALVLAKLSLLLANHRTTAICSDKSFTLTL